MNTWPQRVHPAMADLYGKRDEPSKKKAREKLSLKRLCLLLLDMQGWPVFY